MKKLFFFALLCLAASAQTNYSRMLSGVNNQTATSYTFVATDSTRLVTFNNASATAATLPSGLTFGFGIGSEIVAQNLGAGTVTITCSSCLIFSNNGSGSATFALTQGQGVELFSAGLNYYALTGIAAGASSVVPSTAGAAGNTYCDQALTQFSVYQGRAVSAQNNGTGVIQDCGAVDLQSTATVNTLYVGGGGTGGIRTSAGWHIGDRDQIIGDNTGKGGTSVSANTGTNYLTTSTFPTGQASGGGITMSAASSGASSVTFTLAAGPQNVIIGPGDQFVVTNGTADSQTYTIKNCGGGAGCITGPGSGNWYQLTQGGGGVVINITPTLTQTQAGVTIIGLIHPVWRFGEPVATSPQDAILRSGFINGDSANGGTGVGVGIMDGAECQENCRAEDIYIRDISVGIRIFGAHRSGTWRNLNVALTNNAVGCPTPGAGSPGTIPLEVAPFNTSIDGFTLFVGIGSTCTPAQITKGGIHVTNNPIAAAGFTNGPLHVTNFHVELNGTNLGGAGCGGTCNSGDGVLIDSTAGSIVLDNGTLCPPASGCFNGIHIASTFVGTLWVNDVSCNATTPNQGTNNWIQDDVNGNTIPCSGILNGTGFYSIALDGTVYTNVGCGNISKGWCIASGGIKGVGAVGFVRAPQLQNFTTPILDSTIGVIPSNMTAFSTTTAITNMNWPVTTGKTYRMECEIPVTFAATATTQWQLFSVSGPVTINLAWMRQYGNTGGASAFQDLSVTGAGSLATAITPATGAPGATALVSITSEFSATATGTIGLRGVPATSTIQPLALGVCRVTQTS